jgi:hypothetical protein
MRRPRPGQVQIKAKEQREPRTLQERREHQAIQAKDAMAAYLAAQRAELEKMARLRAARLATAE